MLLDGDTLLVDFSRQTTFGGGHAVLGKDVRCVLVGSNFKVDVKQHAAVAGVRRLHVNHPVDAVDFLFDRNRYRLLNCLSRGARISPGDADVGRRQEGILFDRKAADGNHADQ